MNSATRSAATWFTVVAPCAGTVTFHASRALASDLDVFAAGEILASVGERVVEAPDRCFVWQTFAADGASVDEGAPLFELRFA